MGRVAAATIVGPAIRTGTPKIKPVAFRKCAALTVGRIGINAKGEGGMGRTVSIARNTRGKNDHPR